MEKKVLFTHKRYDELKDEELIELIHEGDDQALEFIIEKYKKLVKVKARPYFIIGADKEDIIQEGMIGLYKAIRDFDGSYVFYSFAELCVKRQIITAIKSAARQKHIPLNSSLSLNKFIFTATPYGTSSPKNFIAFSLIISATINLIDLSVIISSG